MTERFHTLSRTRAALILGAVLSLAATQAHAQDEYGLGMNDTSPRLLEAVRSAAPSASYVESAAHDTDALPAHVDLSARMPTPGHQGAIGSCGAWAAAYALRSYQENVERGWGADAPSELFSPSFLYNLFSDGEDRGSHFPGLFALLQKRGCATLATMPYTEDVSVRPSDEALREAATYRIVSYSRLDPSKLEAIRAVLAGGQPVVFGAMVYEDFLHYDGGIYTRGTHEEYGRHGMILTGYDDRRGAVKLMNSWGTGWGEGGYAWMSYETFRETAFEAFTVEDQVESPEMSTEPPAAVRASRGASTTMVRVSWKPLGAPAYFTVYRADNTDASFEQLGTARNAGFRDETALPGVEYLYAVRSVFVGNDGVERTSDLSTVASGWRAAPDEPSAIPGMPEGLSAVPDGGRVRLRWRDVERASGYRVYRFDETHDEFRGVGETRDTGFVDIVGDEPAADSVGYVVTAFNEQGEGQATEVVIVSLETRGPALQAPEWIGVDTRAGPGQQGLRWTAVDGADAYVIEEYEPAASTWTQAARVTATEWRRAEWDSRATFRVVPMSGARRGDPSHGIVMGRLPVAEEEFDDARYRDAEWERRRRELGFSRRDDSSRVPATSRSYDGTWVERDLFDFEAVQRFFEEARRAEEEAFRRYRADEERAFREFLENEQGR
jgi:fibronectin type 3 domain-containing protein